MGFKEDLITNWKDKTIEYQDKHFYILEQFEYNNKEYIFGVDKNTINNENLEVVFLYKIKNDIFEHVEDEKLFEELFLHVSGMLAAQKLEEISKKYSSNN